MICYAVIDTNVLVSALLSGKEDAATVQIVGKVIIGELVEPSPIGIILPDKKDLPFYEAVLEKCGDKKQ